MNTSSDPKGHGLAAVWLVFTLILTHTDMPHWMMLFCLCLMCFGMGKLTGQK